MIRIQQSGKALGSDVALTLVVKDEDFAKLVFKELWAKIISFENRFSRFKTDSETSVFNENAGKSVEVSPEFREILKSSKKYYEITDGIYNPLILPSLQRAGYKGSWPMPSDIAPTLDYTNRKSKNIYTINIDESGCKIPVDTAIDFGGIGKGFLLDKLADILENINVQNYWLSLGGDIICSGFADENNSWRIGIANAHDSESVLENVENNNGEKIAIATSGITKRKGDGWHHIIDPRTGDPAKTDILTATVTSSSATEADVIAKCLVALGSTGAGKFVTEHNGIWALLQTTKQTVQLGYA